MKEHFRNKIVTHGGYSDNSVEYVKIGLNRGGHRIEKNNTRAISGTVTNEKNSDY